MEESWPQSCVQTSLCSVCTHNLSHHSPIQTSCSVNKSWHLSIGGKLWPGSWWWRASSASVTMHERSHQTCGSNTWQKVCLQFPWALTRVNSTISTVLLNITWNDYQTFVYMLTSIICTQCTKRLQLCNYMYEDWGQTMIIILCFEDKHVRWHQLKASPLCIRSIICVVLFYNLNFF